MGTQSDFSLHMAETIAANTEVVLLKSRMSVMDIVRKSNEMKAIPSISTYVIHCMRTGKSFPGADKVLTLGAILNVDPRDFLQPRTNKEVGGFLQLNFKEKYIRASLLAREGDNLKIN